MTVEIITSILMIVGIDVVLGGDNAIVIALASRNLPESERNKAILLGTGLAVTIRILLTILAVSLLAIPYLQLIGGVLLLLIAFKLLTGNHDDTASIKGAQTLGTAVKTIVFADLVMGLDNVIAIAGASHGNILLVVTGLLISVPIIIWGSKVILYLMERFKSLVYIGAGILSYTAGTMIFHEKNLQPLFSELPHAFIVVHGGSVALVLFTGYVLNQIKLLLNKR
ncbi:TerC family protein [Priestia koreensis]|uniref:YjbE family integral membrane protein n=2 Tax=Priestia koreensis TaxID=284581 RepID=A0A0M0LGU4_9BACI|nr:TerC family protein [Priestia koreensis]KOO50305.1 hypothetical protein AMD01_00645 [Priestia koreensis]